MTHAIPAFALLGMEDELRLAKEVAERELHQQLSISWAFHDPVATLRVLSLAGLIGRPGLLPAGWIAEISHGPGDPVLQHHALLTAAFMGADWAGVETQAAILNRDFPTHYNFFWYCGLALHHLGRNREAAEALATSTTYAKDENDYPLAAELRKQIRATLTAKP